jgi:hypothetical protein
MVVVPFVILVSGLAAFYVRLGAQLRAALRSRATGKMMSRKLQLAVRRHNIRQAIGALRPNKEIKIRIPESEPVDRDKLYQRIEKIRLRSMRNHRHPGSGTSAAKWSALYKWVAGSSDTVAQREPGVASCRTARRCELTVALSFC